MLADGRPGRRWSAEPGQVDRHPDPTSKALRLPDARPARCPGRRELDFAGINAAARPTADEDGDQRYVAFGLEGSGDILGCNPQLSWLLVVEIKTGRGRKGKQQRATSDL